LIKNVQEEFNIMKSLIKRILMETHQEVDNYMFFSALKRMRKQIDDILEMDETTVDQILNDGHNWALDHIITSKDDIEEVYNFLMGYEDMDESYLPIINGKIIEEDEYGSVELLPITEAEYKGRKVTLNKPFYTPDGPKKRSVYVKNEKGNIVKVNFGDPNMKIKKSSPSHRKSFRARHHCENPGPKTSAKYWSCKAR